MFELIVDEDITLRLHDMADLDEYFKLIKHNHDHIAQYMDWVDTHQTVENTRQYILYARKQFGNRKEITTKIYYQGKMAGSIGIIIRDEGLKLGEIGYWLDENFIGKGIITRATRALTDYGFTTLGLHKIEIRAMLHNERSLAIPKRLGYAHQGINYHATLHYGKYYDFDVYYMLNENWTPTLNQPDFVHMVADDIELRVFQPFHADELHAVTDANREFVGRWIPPVLDDKTVEDRLKFIQSGLRQYADRDGMQMGIWYKGKLCGACGYHYWNFRHKNTEIGYWLAEDHTGKGIITRVVKSLINYAFDVQKLHRIEIHCAVENKASCAIPERLGFTHDGIARKSQKLGDEYVDVSIYSILSDEWEG